MSRPLVAAAVALTLCAGSRTQTGPAAPPVQVAAATYARQSSAVFFYSKTSTSFDVYGQCEVTYGAPPWQAAHGRALAASAPGQRLRLGKDFWTTLDTSVPLRAGAVTLPAGTWYLALEKVAAAGDEPPRLHLVLLDAAKVRAQKLYASLTEQSRGGALVPLRQVAVAEDTAPVEALSITFERAAAPDGGAPPRPEFELVLRWGDLEFRAEFTPVLAPPGAAGDGR